MAVERFYGGPGTSDVASRGGLIEHRTAPIVVPPKLKGSPLELAFLQQQRRAADLNLLTEPATTHNAVLPLIKNREKEVKPFRGGQRTGELILATNPTLDALLDKIHYTRPNWDYLKGEFAEHYGQHYQEALHGFLAELHINTILKTLSGYKRWRNVLKLPDLDKMQTPNYRFSTDGGSLGAISKKTRQYEAEYDALIEVDSLPTIIEVKARKVDGEKTAKDVEEAIGDAHIRKLFAPLQELYGPHTYFGYAFVTVPETISRPTSIRTFFQEEGGLVTTMNTTLAELKAQSLQVVFDAKKSA